MTIMCVMQFFFFLVVKNKTSLGGVAIAQVWRRIERCPVLSWGWSQLQRGEQRHLWCYTGCANVEHS